MKSNPIFRDNNYTFRSRYGDKRFFQLEDNKWYFICAEGYDYMRTIFDKDPENPLAVDASGGPYLNVGSKFGDYVDVLPEHHMQITAIKWTGEKYLLEVTGAKQTKTKKP